MTTLVQTVAAASAGANPASIAAAPASTQVGTFLYCVVVAIGAGTPTISTPAGFTPQVTTATTVLRTSIFTQANNPGSITSVTANLTNTTGAVMFVVELTGNPLGALQILHSFGSTGAGTTYAGVQGTPLEDMYLERWFVSLAHNTAQAQSTSPGPGYVQVGGTQISTVGSPAVEARLYTAEISSLSWATPAGVLAGSTDNSSTLTKIAGDTSTSVAVGAFGATNPRGYSGAGGAGPG